MSLGEGEKKPKEHATIFLLTVRFLQYPFRKQNPSTSETAVWN